MNTLKIKKILLITAIISSILSCTMFFIIKLENSMYIMYYPFELVGKIIRSLSLSSSIGNIVSWIIYISICMIPTVIYFYRYKKGIGKSIDFVLIALSMYLFYMMYKFINPVNLYLLMPSELNGDVEFLKATKLSISMMFYIILISYLVLISMNYLSQGEKDTNLKGLQIVLALLLVAYLVAIFYFGLFDIFKNIGRDGFVFYLIKYVLLLAPNIMSMVVVFTGIDLVNTFSENQYGETVVGHIGKIYQYSKFTVYLSILSSLLANGMQIFLFPVMHNIELFLNVPFIPLIVAFVGIILCRYFKENNDLFEDNNSII